MSTFDKKRAIEWVLVLLVVCCAPMGLACAQDAAIETVVILPSIAPGDAASGAPDALAPPGASPTHSDDDPAASSSSPQATSAPHAAGVGPAATRPRDVTEGTIFPNILRDQKDLWLFPLKLDHGRHWFPAVSIVAVTASLVALDEKDTPYFRNTSTFGTFNKVFASNITNAEILVAPASFYVVGLFDKDPYARKTGLFAAEALADVTILDLAMKGVTRRLRPSDMPPNGDFSDSFFKANHNPLSSSFPSGHTISAFAVATVIARRYGHQHKWVPYVAYGAAGLIGFSRVPLGAHFPSDVFLGAALGYTVARFDVLRQSGEAPVH